MSEGSSAIELPNQGIQTGVNLPLTQDGPQDQKILPILSRLERHIEPIDNSLESQIKEQLSLLKPEIIITDDGITRHIYTFTREGREIKVMFYPSNELPVSEAFFRGKRLHVIGDKPGWRTDDDWDAYVTRLQELNSPTARRPGEDLINPTNFYADDPARVEETLILVEQNPRALVDLALATANGDTKDLEQTRKLLADHKTTSEIDLLIDSIIASKILDNDGHYRQPDPSDTSGEALAVLALQGEIEARKVLDLKQKQLATYDNEQQIVENNQLVELNPDDKKVLNVLSSIHVTRYLPTESADGDYWEIPTTFDANPNDRIPRLTWHTTLQQRTGENAMAMGSTKFAGTPYALITRFGSLIEANGKPLSSSPEDTFFEISPGRKVRIPKEDAVLVRPGNPTELGAIFERRGEQHEVVYKHTEFTPQDIKKIYGAGDNYHDDIKLKEAFFRALRGKDNQFEIPNEDVRTIVEQMGGLMFDENGQPPQVSFDNGKRVDSRSLISELSTSTLEDVIETYLPKAKFPGSNGEQLRGRLTEILQGKIGSKAKDLAMDSVVEEYRNGTDITNDPSLKRAFNQLHVENLGTPGHSNSDWGHLESAMIRELNSLLEGIVDQQVFHNDKSNDINRLSPAMRKMYYYLGLL